MKTSAMLPVGNGGDVKTMMIRKGDVLKLNTGETVTFLEMKRVKFIAKDHKSGTNYQIPIWRLQGSIPFILEKTGKQDKSVFTKSVPTNKLKYGDLFALEGKKETFMFLENSTKRGDQPVIKAINLADGRTFTIGTGFTIVKINLAKIKRENKVNA